MTIPNDHAKRLAEIEAILAAAPVYLDAQQTARMHAALTPLLAEMKRVQAENSMFSGAMDWMMRTIAEALIEAGETPSPLADELTKQAAAKVREAGAASEALDALGVAPGSLAERVRALGSCLRHVRDAGHAWSVSNEPAESALTLPPLALACCNAAEAVALHVAGAPVEDDRLSPSERARLEAQATPATRAFLGAMREMRRTGNTAKGLEAFQAFLAETMPRAATPPPEPDLEPAVGDGPAP